MASSLSQICVLCSTLKMSGIPLEIEKNIQAMKISLAFTGAANQRFKKSLISPLLYSLSCFWLSFIMIEVLNEEEYSILGILHCYSLQQCIFLAFCNDFDTCYRMFTYIPLRNKIFLFPKWIQKPAHPIFHYSLDLNKEKGNFTNFKNLFKINESNCNLQ